MQYESSDSKVIASVPLGLRLLRLAMAVIQNALMGGCLYGFAALEPMLQTEATKGGAGLHLLTRQIMFFCALAFGTGSSMLFSAVALDKVGPRWTSVIFTAIFALGCYLFSISERHSLCLFIPAMALIAFAGPGIQTSTNYTSTYFPDNKNLVITILSVSYHMSFLVFYALNHWWQMQKASKQLYLEGYRNMFEMLARIAASTILMSLCIHSDEDSPYVLVQNAEIELIERNAIKSEKRDSGLTMNLDHTEHSSDNAKIPAIAQLTKNDTRLAELGAAMPVAKHGFDDENGSTKSFKQTSLQPSEHPHIPYGALKNLSLTEKLSSTPFIYLAAFFTLSSFSINFYLGTMETSLGDANKLPFGAQQQAAQEFIIVLSLGFVIVPVFNRFLGKRGSMFFPSVLTIYAVLSILCSIGLMWDTNAGLLPTYICYSVMRTLLYCFITPYTHDLFGVEHGDVLVGILGTISGLCSLAAIPLAFYLDGTCAERKVQYPINPCDNGRWNEIVFLKAVASFYIFFYAYHEWKQRLFSETQALELAINNNIYSRHSYGALDMTDVEIN